LRNAGEFWKQQTGWTDVSLPATSRGRVKNNMQLPEDHPATEPLGNVILGGLEQSALSMTAALPLKAFPLLFNRYEGGQSFGSHVDNVIRQVAGSPHRVRTDLSATLFLTTRRNKTEAN
jgi:PKHD-type hydroxylase